MKTLVSFFTLGISAHHCSQLITHHISRRTTGSFTEIDTVKNERWNLMMRLRFSIIIFSAIALTNGLLLPIDATASDRGATLDHPRGRYKESDPPSLFKWTLLKPADSITVKVFRKNKTENYSQEQPIGRFDFLNENQSFKWDQGTFTPGEYVWFLETHSKNSEGPLTVDSTEFKIDPVKSVLEHSARIGGMAGFSRGKYKSNNSVKLVDYDISPAHYGVFYGEDHIHNMLNVLLVASDFVLKDTTQNSYALSGDYLFALKEPSVKFKIYSGPSVKALQLTSVVSTDGTTLTRNEEYFFQIGAALFMQGEFKRDINIYAKTLLHLPVLGSEDLDATITPINFAVHSGLTFELLWPMSFGAELFYDHKAVDFKKDNQKIELEQSDWGLNARVMYVF